MMVEGIFIAEKAAESGLLSYEIEEARRIKREGRALTMRTQPDP